MGQHEKITKDEGSVTDDEDDYESEDDWEDSHPDIPEFDAESYALRIMRETFEKVEAGEPYMGFKDEEPQRRTYIDAKGRETYLDTNAHNWRTRNARGIHQHVSGYESV
jgi:hypothetical protein